MKGKFHEPVMVSEVINYLAAGPGRVIVDGTLGGGGHAEAMLRWTGPGSEIVEMLVGMDRDPEAVEESQKRLDGFKDRVRIRQASFDRFPEVLDEEGMEKVDGILLDLGASLNQLKSPERGFSLWEDAPLDMRMDNTNGETVAGLIDRLGEKDLAGIIRRYGEEKNAGRIARALVQNRKHGRPVTTTRQLRDLVERVSPPGKNRRIHPATRTFMALRIAVNRELELLEQTLERIPERLAPGGRAVVISYHSLEDRLVKQAFAREARGCVCPPEFPRCTCGRSPRMRVLTPRPLQPSPDEVERNPAARSARLRAAEKMEKRG